MKNMKGRFLKKLNLIRPIISLKQDRFLQVDSSDGLLDPLPPVSTNRIFQNSSVCKEHDQKINHENLPVPEPDIIDISDLLSDSEEEEMEFLDAIGDKENIGPPKKAEDPFTAKENLESGRIDLRNSPLSELDVSSFRRPDPPPVNDDSETPQSSDSEKRNLRPLSEIDVSSFRRPDLNSGTLFDPNLLAAFQQAVKDHIQAQEAERKARAEEIYSEKEEEPPPKTRRMDENPLSEFEEKCPPGGSDSVILYTTSLRGIRKTFEDCHSIRFLLGSFRILYYERDISMHLEFREELWKILGGRVVPPRLFIKGRYIGGADEVVGLHERGKLRQLLEGVAANRSDGPCEGCAGMRFVLCFNCNGSRRVCAEGSSADELPVRCPECNENGLRLCPICC